MESNPQQEYLALLRKHGYGVTPQARDGPSIIPENCSKGDTITVKGEKRIVLKVTECYLDCCDTKRIRYYRLRFKQAYA